MALSKPCFPPARAKSAVSASIPRTAAVATASEAIRSTPSLTRSSSASQCRAKKKSNPVSKGISSSPRHRAVTVLVGRWYLQRFQPAPHAAACLIDRGSDGNRPLSTTRGNLNNAHSKIRRESGLKPGPEYQRPHIPAPRDSPGRRRAHWAVEHPGLHAIMDTDPVMGVSLPPQGAHEPSSSQPRSRSPCTKSK